MAKVMSAKDRKNLIMSFGMVIAFCVNKSCHWENTIE